eukprot:6209092-Pleurochrysis_carterae.AAC.1
MRGGVAEHPPSYVHKLLFRFRCSVNPERVVKDPLERVDTDGGTLALQHVRDKPFRLATGAEVRATVPSAG